MRLHPDVEQQVFEVALVRKLPQDHVHFTDDQFEHVEFLVEDFEQVIFHRAARRKVENAHFAILPDAVNAPDALFDAHRVPGNVEIDHRAAKLEIASFPGGFGGEQHLGVMLEICNCLILGPHIHLAVIGDERESQPAQAFGQTFQRAAEMGKDDDLFGRVVEDGEQKFFERIGLGPGLDAGGLVGEFQQFAAMFGVAGACGQRAQGRLGRLGAAANFTLKGEQCEAVHLADAISPSPFAKHPCGVPIEGWEFVPLLLRRVPVRVEGLVAGKSQVRAHIIADRLIKIGFLLGKSQANGAGLARRQFDVHLAASVTHHHVAQQITQLSAIFGQARVAVRHESLAKLARGFQLTGLEQGNQVIQFIQVIFDRGGGQE